MEQGPDAELRKRRDSLQDAITAPVYTDAPTPPYIFLLEKLIYSCYRFASGAADGILPEGIAADPDCVAIICIYRHGPGWGMAHATGGFLSVVVDGYPAPDTGQAAWIVGGFIGEPAATLHSRYYAPFAPGRSEIRIEGQQVTGNLWSEAGHVCEMVITLDDAPVSENSTGDRYLGRNEAGEETSSIWSVTGSSQGASFNALTWGPAAPEAWRALSPVHLDWGTLNSTMLVNLSVPEPLREPSSPATASGLLASLEAARRAACLVDPSGQLLQSNALARRMLTGTAMARTGRILPQDATERARMLVLLAQRQSTGAPGPVVLPRAGGQAPLIAQIAPLDPAIAPEGSTLVLLTDPDARREPPRAELLQLLSLTPAEARVAALVGAGLTPREAALRLGLSEGTVRSTLKEVFSKLGVRRQAELVRLVARLDPG